MVTMRECNHIWAASRVDLVHPSPEVICGVIHAHRVPLLKAVASDEDLVAVVVHEGGGFWIILAVKDVSEEVVHQFWDEVLVSELVRSATETCGSTYFQSRVIWMLTQCPFIKP